jgi:hypothetical protein
VNPLFPHAYYLPLSSVVLAEINHRRATRRISGSHRCWDVGSPPRMDARGWRREGLGEEETWEGHDQVRRRREGRRWRRRVRSRRR